MSESSILKVICLSCMAFSSDHCTARCPTIKCKLCKKYGHVKKDCPKLEHVIKDYTRRTSEHDEDLIVYWGGHCDVCKQGAAKGIQQLRSNRVRGH